MRRKHRNIAAKVRDVIKHTMVERVPYRWSYARQAVIPAHERHTLTCGPVAAHGNSLKDCERIMNIHVHGAR